MNISNASYLDSYSLIDWPGQSQDSHIAKCSTKAINNLGSIPVELQYAIAKCCGLDYTAVFNLLCILPGLKSYVEGYKHLKQELAFQFLKPKEKYTDGNKVLFFVKGGVKTGEYKLWNGKGVLIKHCHYKNDKKEGECKRWNYNGQLHMHCFYKNDELYGEYKEWYANGQLSVHCFYKNNELDGTYKHWSVWGALITNSLYRNGKFRFNWYRY